MSEILDDQEEIKKLDKSNVAESIAKFPDQIEQAWNEASKVKFPDSYKEIKNLVIVGMGGSALGPELLSYLYKDKLEIPLLVVHDYNLPNFVDENSLVILSSYSGTTEEVLNAAEQTIVKKCKVAGITEGRELGKFLDKNSLPYYKIKADSNPSEQPRLGLGYSVAGILGMFNSLGLIVVDDKEKEEVIASTKNVNSQFIPSKSISNNFTKELATKLKGSSVGVIAAEFLSTNAHIFANQLNETSKTFSSYYLLSELNHHLLEGFNKPEDLRKNLKIVILLSDQYSDKLKKRVKITTDVIEKQKVETFIVKFEEGSRLNQVLEAILVSSWTTFYLGILNGFDPSGVPWVDYFKEQLAKG